MKQLPYSRDEEMAVLGAAFLGPEFAQQVAVLTPEFFHDEQARSTFTILKKDFQAGISPDPLRIGQAIGNIALVASLVDNLSPYPPVEQYIRDLRAYRQRREMVALAQELALQAAQGTSEPDDLLGLVRHRLEKIEALEGVKRVGPFGSDLKTILSNLGERVHLSTGYSDLDLFIHGMERGQLILLAGRPGHAKSATAQAIFCDAPKEGAVVAVFSLEMSKKELGMRILAAEANVPLNAIRSNNLSPHDRMLLSRVSGSVDQWSLYIEDRASLRVDDIASLCHGIRRQTGRLDLVVIDYLGLLTPQKAENRYAEVGGISRSLKLLAKDMNVPVLALHQLNRDLERKAREPVLADLRDSGRLEEDADVVLFIFRPTEPDGTLSNNGKIIVAKNRNGELGTVPVRMSLNVMRVLGVDSHHA